MNLSFLFFFFSLPLSREGSCRNWSSSRMWPSSLSYPQGSNALHRGNHYGSAEDDCSCSPFYSSNGLRNRW